MKNYLKDKDKNDITESIKYFLQEQDKKLLKNWRYETNGFYIIDRILCIKKNTLEIDIIGRISYLNNGKIGINRSKHRNICIDPKKYYLFLRNKTEDIKNREFMKQLLEKL